ncbi:MAG: CHASE2 domain-containing protein [Candidatus Omnitrophota bacterium]
MNRDAKLKIFSTLTSLLLCIVFFFSIRLLHPFTHLNWKIYDKLTTAQTKLTAAPKAKKDILLVVLDNKTLNTLPSRWPYPRSYFAAVIDNLTNAGAKVIAFDFVFLGESSPEEDQLLKQSLSREKNIVLASTINAQGEIDLFSNKGFSQNIPIGIVTKLQDHDEIIRKGLTFLVNEQSPNQILLSWEMQILNMIKHIDLTTIKQENSHLIFNSNSGEKWEIPIDTNTMSFLIRFRCNTSAFNRISFSDVLKNNFNPELVQDKIVLIGFLSQTFGDIHNTPLRWLPGITLNANTFLTLYTHSFINKIPVYIEFILLFIGVLLSCIFVNYFKFKKALLIIIIEILVFFMLSYLLLIKGYIWNYSIFPIIVILSPLLGRKIFDLIWHSQSILFVHQDTSTRDLFYQSFAGLKYKIITAYSNKEAFSLLKNYRPDYVILDPTDTDKPASQAEKEIKSIDPSITVITPHPKLTPQQFIHNILLRIKDPKQPIADKNNDSSKKEAPVVINNEETYVNKKPPSKTNILIIDDEIECVELIKHYLSKRGYSVETAASGEEAMTAITKGKPDIVILDIRMEGMDGLVVLKEIKNIDKSIMVIMSSALENQTIVKEALNLGADHYLIKPFSLAELEKIIHKSGCF